SNLNFPMSWINDKYPEGRLVATAFRDKPGMTWSYKLYAYDHLGRVTDFYIYFNNTTSYKRVSSEYDNLGNLVKQYVYALIYFWYDYDEQGRLQFVWSNKDNAKTSAKLEAEYSYDKSDMITVQRTNSLVDHKMQTLFDYDTRGRVTSILGKTRFSNGEIIQPWETLFSEQLTYYNNSNVNTQTITNNGNSGWDILNFNYSYDGLNRLDSSICSNDQNLSRTFKYDADGNFLEKDGLDGRIHYFYHPGTNILKSLIYSGMAPSFTHDYRGNMTYDGLKDITISDYDRRNLPLKMTKEGDEFNYSYDDNGQRIYKQSPLSSEYYLRDQTGREIAIFDLSTDKIKMANIFGNGLIGRVDANWQQEMIWDPEERDSILVWARYDSRYYYLKDHLGSIRTTIDEDGEVVAAQDYFPFGEVIPGRSLVSGGLNEKYKFTGKERDAGTTEYDYFGARFYDSELGRWLSVDPLADMYPGWSPYNYTLNNPLFFIDPTGMSASPANAGEEDKTGKNVVGEGPNPGIRFMDEQLKAAVPEFKKVPEKALIALIELSDGTSDLASGTAGTALLTGNVPVATDALTISLVADFTSLGLKGLHNAVYGGSENEFSNQLVVTTISVATTGLTKVGIGKLIESTAGKTGNTLYRNPSSKKFVKNFFGNTVNEIKSAINTAVSLFF
ncbi:RHS repeat domain-containing protein, partial [Bacteroidota bacterium]